LPSVFDSLLSDILDILVIGEDKDLADLSTVSDMLLVTDSTDGILAPVLDSIKSVAESIENPSGSLSDKGLLSALSI
jgi:hypothetical protein